MASVANINELGGYALNPRGNLWFNDDSTFGQKMLMKMGWSKGKGLGKNEDGIKENLKVKFKCTNAGLGYKDQSYDNVMKGEYESILKNLSAEYSRNNIRKTDVKNINGKQKRKIRYPKLFYGKDVSKYSEKDMKSIFLCSFPSHKKEDEEVKSNNSVSSCLADSKKELPKLLDSYNSQLNVSDYFTLKMEAKKGNKLKKELGCEIYQDYSNIMSNETKNSIVISDRKKDKKKKKKLINLNGDLLNLEGEEAEFEKSNKKRRKISHGLYHEDSSDVNNLEAINSTQYSQSKSLSKKRKKSHKSDNTSSTNENIISNDSDVSCSVLSPPSKKRKMLHGAGISECEESVELLSVNAIKQGMCKENNESHKLCSNPNEAQCKSSSNNNTKTKKSVKLKNKLKTLKSCLKSKKSKFAFKNVSYKTIDSRFEAEKETPICIDIDQCDSLTQETSNNYELEKDSNDITSVQNESFITENGSDDLCSSSIEYDCNDHSETDFPSSKSSYYNSWIESQKLALKMKMYTNMLKNIKKHAILKTTNMLSIKGYGNWGFK